MIKNILILVFLFHLNSGLFAQKIIKISDDHYLDYSKVEDGKPLLINKYVNYNLYLKLGSDSVKNLNGIEKDKFYDMVFAKMIVKLKKGDYYFDNPYAYFKFHINKKGLLEGNALLRQVKKNTETDMVISEGVLISSVAKKINIIYVKTELKDSIFINENYYEKGNMVVIEYHLP